MDENTLRQFDELRERIKNAPNIYHVKGYLHGVALAEELIPAVKAFMHELIDADKYEYAEVMISWFIQARKHVFRQVAEWEYWLKQQSFGHMPINSLRDLGLPLRMANALSRSMGGDEPLHELLIFLERGPQAMQSLRNVGEETVRELVKVLIAQKFITREQLEQFGFTADYFPTEEELTHGQ